jgi:hypothetical protein
LKKPHIRLRVKKLMFRGCECFVWRAQEGEHPIKTTWWPNPARALSEHIDADAVLRHIDRLVSVPEWPWRFASFLRGTQPPTGGHR